MPGFLTHLVPAARMPGTPPAAPQREQPGGSGSLGKERARILAVDDEPEALDVLRALFAAEGFEVMQTASAAQAIAAIEAEQPDLLIVDYMMPGMSGIELCEYLRRAPATRHIPIVIYSAYTLPPSYADRGLYDRVFTKPADHEELLAAIRGLLRAGQN